MAALLTPDAIADALCYGFAMIVVAAYGWVPWGAVAIILALGAVNMVMRGLYAKRAGRTTNYQSHAMERLVAFAAYLGAFGTNQYEADYFFWTFTALMAVVIVRIDSSFSSFGSCDTNRTRSPAVAIQPPCESMRATFMP